MKAYSMELRRRVWAACEAGETTSEVAERFGVSPAWVRRLKQRLREEGTIQPRASGGDRRGKFDAASLAKLARQVDAQPDATLEQLAAWTQEQLGISCSVMAICRALKRIGLTLKKNDSRRRAGSARRRPKPKRV